MKVTSTNLGSLQKIKWKEREGETGLFKYPVAEAIFLGKDGVLNDSVGNLVAHGGSDKACYLFSEKHYSYWKNLYPDLDWNWGMFGENLTISDFDESLIRIGDIFQIGTVFVQVSQPRKPCWKLDYRFNSDEISKQFIAYRKSGTYVRILKEGYVENGDKMALYSSNENSLTLVEVFDLLFKIEGGEKYLEKAVYDSSLAESCRKDLILKWGL